MNFNDDDYFQGYRQIKEAFRALTKDDILQPLISEQDFGPNNNVDTLGYNLYVFDILCQKKLESAQPTKVEFKSSENSPAGIFGYALVSTIKLVSLSSDGQPHFDLICLRISSHLYFLSLLIQSSSTRLRYTALVYCQCDNSVMFHLLFL